MSAVETPVKKKYIRKPLEFKKFPIKVLVQIKRGSGTEELDQYKKEVLKTKASVKSNIMQVLMTNDMNPQSRAKLRAALDCLDGNCE